MIAIRFGHQLHQLLSVRSRLVTSFAASPKRASDSSSAVNALKADYLACTVLPSRQVRCCGNSIHLVGPLPQGASLHYRRARRRASLRIPSCEATCSTQLLLFRASIAELRLCAARVTDFISISLDPQYYNPSQREPRGCRICRVS